MGPVMFICFGLPLSDKVVDNRTLTLGVGVDVAQLYNVMLLYFGLPLSDKVVDNHSITFWGWGRCSSVGTASDRHTADAGSIPRCGKGLVFGSTFSADSLTVSVHPQCAIACVNI